MVKDKNVDAEDPVRSQDHRHDSLATVDFNLFDQPPGVEISQNALVAEVSVHRQFPYGVQYRHLGTGDDLDVVVSFEDHYWPEEKEPTAAIEAAAVLGIEIELEVFWSDPLFAWPGLGTVTQSAAEYTRMMLDAYRSHGIIEERDENR